MNEYKLQVEIRLAKTLRATSWKGKTIVKDGVFRYEPTVWPPNCQCSRFVVNYGCRHVFRLLLDKDWSELDLKYIRFAKSADPGQSDLQADNECSFCLDTVSIVDAWVCEVCHKAMHSNCVSKWLKDGKGCPVCRSVSVGVCQT